VAMVLPDAAAAEALGDWQRTGQPDRHRSLNLPLAPILRDRLDMLDANRETEHYNSHDPAS
jgi:hypothetical protein